MTTVRTPPEQLPSDAQGIILGGTSGEPPRRSPWGLGPGGIPRKIQLDNPTSVHPGGFPPGGPAEYPNKSRGVSHAVISGILWADPRGGSLQVIPDLLGPFVFWVPFL